MPYWGDLKDLGMGKRIVDNVRLLKRQQLVGSQIEAWFWFRDEARGQVCSCAKGDLGRSQPTHSTTCLTCYNTKKVGGYYKYGYETVVVAAIDPKLQFTDIEVWDEMVPHRLVLSDTKLSGSFITDRYDITNYLGGEIEYEMASYKKDPNNSTIKLQYSIDDNNWFDIEELTGRLTTIDKIRFKVTMTRATAATTSPWFEVLRFRYENVEDATIRVVKNMPTRRDERKLMGKDYAEAGMRFSMAAEPQVPQYSLIQLLDGEHLDERYFVASVSTSELMAGRISQRFSVRNIQPGEVYAKIF